MRNQLLAVICLMLLSQIALSQECSMLPPDGLDCSTAIHLCGKELNGFASVLPVENIGNNPNDQLCFNSSNDGGMVNNITWYSFIACADYVEIRITPDNCTVSNALVGLQAGIYAECDFNENMVCVVDCFDNATSLAASGFIPNEKYYLFVDGCNGSVCDYRIDVITGIDTDDITLEIENNQTSEINGDPSPCLSSVVNYFYSVPSCTVVGECMDYDPFELGLACYEWTIPASATIIGNPNGAEIEVEFGATGNFEISVELFLDPSIQSCAGGQGACGNIPPLQLDVSLPNYTNLDPIYICPGDSVHFCGNFYTSPEEVLCENPLDACSAQIQPILYSEEVVENLGVISVCPGECAEVNGMQFCNPNVYEIPKNTCDTVIRFELEIFDFDVTINGLEQINCDKPQIQLEAVANFNGATIDFIWRDINGTIVASGPLGLIFIGGDYTLEAVATKNGYECSKIVDFFVDQDSDVPSFSLEAEDLNCNNEEVEIQFISGNNIISYSWVGPTNFVSDIPNPIVDEAGDYELTVASANGCTVTQIITVVEDKANPVLDWQDPTLNCLSPSINLNVNSDIPIFEYQWIAPDGNPGSGMSPMIDQPGQYSFIAVGENGCTSDFMVNVSDDFDLPQAIINSDVITCLKPLITLSFETTYNIVNQTWISPDSPNLNSETIDITAGGNYILELEADNGCFNQIPFTIVENNDSPIVDLGADLMWNCNTKTISIEAVVENGSFNYSWSTQNGNIVSGNSSSNLIVDEPGTYTFEVVNPVNGCLTTEEINIDINPEFPTDARISTVDPQCFGDFSGAIQIDEIFGGVPPFNVFVNGSSMGTDMVMNDYNAGIYSVEIHDANECSYSTQIELFNPLEIILDMEERVQLYYGDETDVPLSYNIGEEEVLEIIWMDKEQNIVSTGSSLKYAPIQSETITAILTSIDGCEIQKDIRVNLRKSIDIFAPNAFTPNGDGINDRFTLYGRSDIAIIRTMSVFDRWGNSIYSGKDLQLNDETEGWDGRFTGQKELNPGVYVYAAVVELLDGTQFNFTGSITLMK